MLTWSIGGVKHEGAVDGVTAAEECGLKCELKLRKVCWSVTFGNGAPFAAA